MSRIRVNSVKSDSLLAVFIIDRQAFPIPLKFVVH